MNYLSVAGITLLGLVIFMGFIVTSSNAAQRKKIEDVKKHIGSTAETMSRADISLISALIMLSVFAPVWFLGNIVYGNVVAITTIVNWVNSVNGDLNLIVPQMALIMFAGLPSVGQWYRIHFKGHFDDGDAIWCLRLQGVDWLFNTIGFYSYAMPLGYPPSGWVNAGIILSFSGVAAWVVGVWGENMLHKSIILCQWVLTTPLEARGDAVATHNFTSAKAAKAAKKGGKK